ncbi:MAG TPA: PAS domain S-box protein, partial [Smithella sp.]|nr:PAS domain S-box protein [Smithella sp.]
MKDQSLRVLMIEDSEDDALIIIRELKRGGYYPVYERVETASAMKEVLKAKQWNIILCDYKMPNFSAPSAIALLKELNIDTPPVIIVSGAIGEETAVECMHLGAQDYIMKGNLSRLCPAIARELEDSKVRINKKHTEEKLHYEQKRFRAFAENSSDIIVIVNREGIITYENPAVERILGFKLEERIGADKAENVHPDDIKHVTNSLNTLFGDKSAPAQQFEVRLRHRDGSWRNFEAIARHMVHDNIVEAIIVNLRDITECKQAEDALRKSEQSLATIFNTVGDVIFHLAVEPAGQFRFVSVNPAFLKITGLSAENVVGRTVNEIIPEPSLTMALGKYQQAITENTIVCWEEISDYPTGRLIGIVSIAPVFDDKGNCTHLVGSVQDITERKKTEEILKERDLVFKKLSANVPGIIFQFKRSPDGRYCVPFATYAVKDIYGFSAEDLVQDFSLLSKVIYHEDFERFVNSIEESAKNMTQWQCEYRIQPSGMPIKWIYGTSTPEKLPDGSVMWHGFNTDITERKQIDELIRQSEEKYRSILENIQEGYFEVDLAGNFTFFNDSLQQFLGYTKEELMGTNNRQYTDKENSKILFQAFNKVYTTGEPTEGFDWQVIKKDGTRKYIEASVSLRKDSSGKPIGFRGMVRDVTERKQVAEKLRESEERYRLIVENSRDIIFMLNAAGKFIYISPSIKEILGYAPAGLIGREISSLIHPDDIPHVQDIVRRSITEGYESRGTEYRVRHASGEWRWHVTRGNVVRDLKGGFLYFIGLANDFTERKQAEEQLHQTLDRLKKAVGTTIQVLGTASEARDPYTAGHQKRVARLARAIATEMGLPQ